MPRRCTICDHPDREEIDNELVEGKPYRSIAKRFNVSAPATLRHKRSHLPAKLILAKKAKEAASADRILANVCKLKSRTERIFRKAEKAEDHRIALSAIRELRNTIELLAKLAGELKDGTTVNVLVTPEYRSLRTTIISTLAPYPEARVAVANALKDIDHAGD